jgi:membrane protease YdiL (CAAX protease family)
MLLLFFLLSFFIAWLFFIAAGLLSGSSPQFSIIAQVFFLIGAISPGLVATILTAKKDGTEGVRLLIGRIFRTEVSLRWYFFAIGYMAIIKLTAAVIFRFSYGHWPEFGTTPWYVMLGAIAVSMWVQAGEEVGWRGYALPLMTHQFGLAGSSLILGIIWALWHIPFFYIQGSDAFNQSFPLYLMQVTALSVAMAWLVWKTNGSLLPVMILHAAINNTKDIVPSALKEGANPMTLNGSPIAWITLGLLWFFAFYFLYRMNEKLRPLL